MGQQRFNVTYIEYPPYYFTKDGQPDGYILEQVTSLLACASIDFSLKSLPSNRALHEVRTGRSTISIGWFKTQEREQYAKYSLPLCQSLPQVAFFRKANEGEFSKYRSLSCLILNSTLKVGVIAGHSEGEAVDAILGQNTSNISRVDAEQLNLIRMLDAGRFDYILLPPEEIEHLLTSLQLPAGDFAQKELEDIPPGNKRYLIFSKDTDDETISRINDCIAKSRCAR
jgi:polar amino acid transport system substrate-binding protein